MIFIVLFSFLSITISFLFSLWLKLSFSFDLFNYTVLGFLPIGAVAIGFLFGLIFYYGIYKGNVAISILPILAGSSFSLILGLAIKYIPEYLSELYFFEESFLSYVGIVLGSFLATFLFKPIPYCTKCKKYYKASFVLRIKESSFEKKLKEIQSALNSKSSRTFFSAIRKSEKILRSNSDNYYECIVFKCDHCKTAYLSFKHYIFYQYHGKSGGRGHRIDKNFKLELSIDYHLANKISENPSEIIARV